MTAVQKVLLDSLEPVNMDLMYCEALEVYYPQGGFNTMRDAGDNHQRMNPTACARKSWANVPAEIAKQPKSTELRPIVHT